MALTSDDWDRVRSGATDTIIALSGTTPEDTIEAIEPDRELLQGTARGYRRAMTLLGYPELISVPDIAFKAGSWWCLSMLDQGRIFYSIWIEAFLARAEGVPDWTESTTSTLLESLGGTFGALLAKSSHDALSAADLRIPIDAQPCIPYMSNRHRDFAESYHVAIETAFAWTLVRDFAYVSIFNGPLKTTLHEFVTVALEGRAIDIFDLIIQHGRLNGIDVLIDRLVMDAGRGSISNIRTGTDESDFASVVALFDAIIDFAGYNCMDGAIDGTRKVIDSLSWKRESRTLSETGLLEVTGLKIGSEVAESARQFVNYAVERNGRRVLPLILTSPDLLPTRSDLDDPDRWLQRSVT